MAQLQHLQRFLDNAHIASEVFDLRLDYRALLLAIEGIKPEPSDDFTEALLKEAEESAERKLALKPITEFPHIAAWRETYKAFGAKPNKTRNSLEALTRRAKGLPRVNRLTDIYNALSVKYQIPFGGEDLDKYNGSPKLKRASGQELFESKAEGKIVVEHPDVGEVVWCDETGVTCRHWNWRQTPRTALNQETVRVLFILDALEPCDDANLDAAVEELIKALKRSSPDILVAKRLITKDTTVSE